MKARLSRKTGKLPPLPDHEPVRLHLFSKEETVDFYKDLVRYSIDEISKIYHQSNYIILARCLTKGPTFVIVFDKKEVEEKTDSEFFEDISSRFRNMIDNVYPDYDKFSNFNISISCVVKDVEHRIVEYPGNQS